MAAKTVMPCPNVEDHTTCPEGYIQWHDWAERMSKTHKQRECPGCGLYAIWEPVMTLPNPHAEQRDALDRALQYLEPDHSEAANGIKRRLRAALDFAEADGGAEAMREAGDYLISLYKRLWQGGVVRDLAEAEAAWQHAKTTIAMPRYSENVDAEDALPAPSVATGEGDACPVCRDCGQPSPKGDPCETCLAEKDNA